MEKTEETTTKSLDKILDFDSSQKLLLDYATKNKFFTLKQFASYAKDSGFVWYQLNDLRIKRVESRIFGNAIHVLSEKRVVEKYNQKQWHSLVYESKK